MDFEERPWGSFQVLDEGTAYKVKRLVVNAGRRLSLQRHARRHEHWTVVSGQATVTRNGDTMVLAPRDSIDIPLGSAHRIENAGSVPLVIIEVQCGDYFGEDDIERLADDYGRAG